MGHAGNGTCRTLALIRISVFRDRISEPRYCDPYLQKQQLYQPTQLAFHDYVTVLHVTSEPTLISLYI